MECSELCSSIQLGSKEVVRELFCAERVDSSMNAFDLGLGCYASNLGPKPNEFTVSVRLQTYILDILVLI